MSEYPDDGCRCYERNALSCSAFRVIERAYAPRVRLPEIIWACRAVHVEKCRRNERLVELTPEELVCFEVLQD